jgi:hypothetical protein
VIAYKAKADDCVIVEMRRIHGSTAFALETNDNPARNAVTYLRIHPSRGSCGGDQVQDSPLENLVLAESYDLAPLAVPNNEKARRGVDGPLSGKRFVNDGCKPLLMWPHVEM